MVFGVNMDNVGRDITRGAVNELRRQVKKTTRDLNPMNKIRNKIRNIKTVKRLFQAMNKKGKGRRRVGRGRRAPPPFFRGSGRRSWR